MAAAYQGAIEAVLAVAICALAGYWLDGRFGTAPRWLFAGLGLGFVAFFVRLWRLRGLMEESAAEAQQRGPGPDRPAGRPPGADGGDDRERSTPTDLTDPTEPPDPR